MCYDSEHEIGSLYIGIAESVHTRIVVGLQTYIMFREGARGHCRISEEKAISAHSC